MSFSELIYLSLIRVAASHWYVRDARGGVCVNMCVHLRRLVS